MQVQQWYGRRRFTGQDVGILSSSTKIQKVVMEAIQQWVKHLHLQDTMTHLSFRKNHCGFTAQGSVWYDGVNNHLASCAQGCCVLCQRNTRLQCIKCTKHLHKHCSNFYHTKWLTLYCDHDRPIWLSPLFHSLVLKLMADINISLKQRVL